MSGRSHRAPRIGSCTRTPPSPTHLGSDTRMATLRQLWWSIPEGGGASANARFHAPLITTTTQSQTLLHNLNYISLYRRLILKNREVGTNTHYVEKSIHCRLAASAWEGSTLLKLIYGQLYNDKLAKRYRHASTDECPSVTHQTLSHT